MSAIENTAEQKICKIIKDAFKLGFDSETNDAIDYFDGIDESEEIIAQLRANTSHFAEQVHSIAAALEMPVAPGHSVIHRVRELIAENNQLRENLWQHAERLEEVEMSEQSAIDILDGNADPIDWRDQSQPELLRKLCEHLEAFNYKRGQKVIPQAAEAMAYSQLPQGELATPVGCASFRQWKAGVAQAIAEEKKASDILANAKVADPKDSAH